MPNARAAHRAAAATRNKNQQDDALTAFCFDTPLEWMAVAWRGDKLAGVTFDHDTLTEAVRSLSESVGAEIEPDGASHLTRKQRELVDKLRRYAKGEEVDFADVELDIDDMTAFQRKVLRACSRVRYGKQSSYARLAKAAGSANAARAVGNVMANNRFAIVVPCHRILAAGGRLGGYSSPGGLATKTRLLEMESHSRGDEAGALSRRKPR